MFEFTLAVKYLLPKRNSLSTSLISLLAVFVISLVVWLVLVFLSVTTGIEKNWLHKLTSLNAPLRITPTERYFSSYYYQIDQLSSSSHYTLKSIGEKARADSSHPYSTVSDAELPAYFPKPDFSEKGSLKDPVKLAFASLETLKQKHPSLAFQDYEISGAFMRLALLRSDASLLIEKTSFLSQMSYLLSFAGNNPSLPELLVKPSIKDLNNLLFQMGKSGEELQKDAPNLLLQAPASKWKKDLQAFFQHIRVKKVRSGENFSIPQKLFLKGSVPAIASKDHKKIFLFPSEEEGKIIRGEKGLTFIEKDGSSWKVPEKTLLIALQPISWEASLAETKEEIKLKVEAQFAEAAFSGILPYQNLSLEDAEAVTHFEEMPHNPPLWGYFCKGHGFLPHTELTKGILLPKSYQESGVLLGDKGYLSYLAQSGGSSQEQRLSVFVAGFYDPGIMPVGNRCLIVPEELARTISSSSSTFSPDGSPTNGIFVWTKDFSEASALKTELSKLFEKEGILPYFKIATYKEYEFSKELMQQFQSDRTLFTLLAGIIIFVACCNIISLLILLVNDKKKEIAILAAMGASKRSIAAIFGLAGVVTGSLGSLIGTFAALFTLKHLDLLVAFLSSLQGHAAFQTAFFGKSLPNELSREALLFVLIATPLLSLLAGCLPALKASKLKASVILRSE